jgi:hypothetical protein
MELSKKEEAYQKIDKMIATAHDIKRRLSLLSDKQCEDAFHEKSHEIIDDRLTKLKSDAGLFIHLNSVINKFLEAADVSSEEFFKKENNRKIKKKAHDKATEKVVDARRLFCYIFFDNKDIKSNGDETMSRFLNTSRFQIMSYKKASHDLIKTDKKFQEYYESTIKKLNLDPVKIF